MESERAIEQFYCGISTRAIVCVDYLLIYTRELLSVGELQQIPLFYYFLQLNHLHIKDYLSVYAGPTVGSNQAQGNAQASKAHHGRFGRRHPWCK